MDPSEQGPGDRDDRSRPPHQNQQGNIDRSNSSRVRRQQQLQATGGQGPPPLGLMQGHVLSYQHQQAAHLQRLQLQHLLQHNQGINRPHFGTQHIGSHPQYAYLASTRPEAPLLGHHQFAQNQLDRLNQQLAQNAAHRAETEQALRRLSATNQAPLQNAPTQSYASARLPYTLQAAAPSSSTLERFERSVSFRPIQVEGADDRKRKADDSGNSGRKKRFPEQLPVTGNSYPLPSLQLQRNVHNSRLLSFHGLWSELEGLELQEEIFRQRIYEGRGLKLVGKSRSIKTMKTTSKTAAKRKSTS